MSAGVVRVCSLFWGKFLTEREGSAFVSLGPKCLPKVTVQPSAKVAKHMWLAVILSG